MVEYLPKVEFSRRDSLLRPNKTFSHASTNMHLVEIVTSPNVNSSRDTFPSLLKSTSMNSNAASSMTDKDQHFAEQNTMRWIYTCVYNDHRVTKAIAELRCS